MSDELVSDGIEDELADLGSVGPSGPCSSPGGLAKITSPPLGPSGPGRLELELLPVLASDSGGDAPS